MSHNQVKIHSHDGKVVFSEDLTKDTVMQVLNQLKNTPTIHAIDLQSVKKVDTAALAMLLELQKKSPQTFKIINPPDRLLKIAKLVEVDFLFN